MRIGTPLSPSATRVMLLGSGELGKEVIIALQRLGCEVVAVDRYPNAPGMQVAHRSHVINMTDGAALRALIEAEKPHLVVPEIEAIATDTLIEIERDGLAEVIPTARAARLTMNREGIRRLAAEELKLPTSPYCFADSLAELQTAIDSGIGYPCIVKPVMSSSGKGQSLIKTSADVQKAWDYSQAGGRVGAGRIIVEGFIDFDYEITQLTVRAIGASGGVETFFCEPIGHVQVAGDYVESWQPMAMSPVALQRSRAIAETITSNLGGRGIFGVELFIKGDAVWFSEVSPRPHDTGLVTLATQRLSEFELHARAILGLPVPPIRLLRPSFSVAVLGWGDGVPAFSGLEKALAVPESHVRLFGKPECRGHRRLGVAVASGDTIEEARERARQVAAAVKITLT